MKQARKSYYEIAQIELNARRESGVRRESKKTKETLG